MISRAVCTTLDHVAKQARFNCDNELDRLNYSIYFALSFLAFSGLAFGLQSLFFNVSVENRASDARGTDVRRSRYS